jgi:hypothetical protein
MAKSSSNVKATETPTNAVESMVSDAVDAQRAIGAMPTPVDAAQFIQPIVEKLDNKPAPKATPSSVKKEGAVEAEFYKKGGTPGSFDDFEIRRRTDVKVEAKKVKRTAPAAMLAHRLQQMRKDPEWMLKMKLINPLAFNGVLGDEQKREAHMMYWRLIKDSCRKFGPLDGGPKPLWFS